MPAVFGLDKGRVLPCGHQVCVGSQHARSIACSRLTKCTQIAWRTCKTQPLLTTASGQKFGKSAGNAVSLNKDDTGVFEFYQVSIVKRTNDVLSTFMSV